MDDYIQQQGAQLEDALTLHLSEAEISSTVAAGGGKYVGVLKETPGKLEPLVLFISLRTRTTLALPISRLSVESVHEHLNESDAAFGVAGSK